MDAHRARGRSFVRTLAVAAAIGLMPAGLLVPAVADAQTAAAEASSGVIAPIQTLDQSLLAVMRAGDSTPFSQRVQMLAPAVDTALNLPAILKEAVGPDWSSMSAAQQAQLLNVFRQYTVATFVTNFDSYNGQTITISPTTRALSGGAQVVNTIIHSGNGKETHTISYVMRKAANGLWKATDVLADGTISRVAVLRSDFSSMLSRGGASALQASLQQKTQKLENS
jgi:phospholipid transport system substrate-binding protein